MSRLHGQIGERQFLGLWHSAFSMLRSDCWIAASLRLLSARNSLRWSRFSLYSLSSFGRVSESSETMKIRRCSVAVEQLGGRVNEACWKPSSSPEAGSDRIWPKVAGSGSRTRI